MIVPFLLLLLSLGGVAVALFLPGWGDLILLAGPMAVAALVLLWRVPSRTVTPPLRRKWVVVDGSNVMHWKDNAAQIGPVSEVLQYLDMRGFTVGIVFDANAGYKLSNRYQDDGVLARILKLPEDRVLVVRKGQPADPVILAAARDLGGRIVINDRYRDWEETHPEVRAPGHLIRGGYRDGRLWLDVE
jgi:Zc3h12a-like Ribonuclease NYN domain